MVEPQQDEQELLLDGTQGVVERHDVVALGQLLLLPGGAKAQVCPHHGQGQVERISRHLLLPLRDERWVDQGKRRAQGGQGLLFGQGRTSALQHSRQDAFRGRHRRVSHVDSHPFSNGSRLPLSRFSVRGPSVPASSPSVSDDVPALLCRGWASPEDGQVDSGGGVGVVPRYRAFDEQGRYFGVGMRV